MRHPFDLDPKDLGTEAGDTLTSHHDLDFEESVPLIEAEAVGGGLMVTTMAIGEEGGNPYCRHPLPKSIRFRSRRPIKEPPTYTTLALGEEGGFDPPFVQPPELTTMAIGEEGGADPV